jgi:hypothetical protein
MLAWSHSVLLIWSMYNGNEDSQKARRFNENKWTVKVFEK